jgi:hypothetical protein
VGSIPIIFSDDLRLPFEDVIDYRAFVVKIFDKNIAELDGLLDRLVDQKLRNLERLKHMKAVREAFWWRPTYKDNLLNPLRLVMQELASKIRRRPIGNMEIIQIES